MQRFQPVSRAGTLRAQWINFICAFLKLLRTISGNYDPSLRVNQRFKCVHYLRLRVMAKFHVCHPLSCHAQRHRNVLLPQHCAQQFQHVSNVCIYKIKAVSEGDVLFNITCPVKNVCERGKQQIQEARVNVKLADQESFICKIMATQRLRMIFQLSK